MSQNVSGKPPHGTLLLSLLITTMGVGWLLTVKGFGPGVDWIWTLGLGTLGVFTFIVSGGLDKVSVVVGPFFLVASLLSILRQTQNLDLDTEAPLLVIAIGVLMFVAHARFIPVPRWFLPLSNDGDPTGNA